MLCALTLVSLAFTVGIAVGEWIHFGALSAALCAAAAALSLLLARRRRALVGVASLMLATTLGLLAVAGARPRPPPELIDGVPWILYGEVAAAPERTATGVRVPIDLIAVERDRQRHEVRVRVLIVLDRPPIEPLLPGDRVRVPTSLRAPCGFVNPGAPDAARRAAAEGIAAVGSVRAARSFRRWCWATGGTSASRSIRRFAMPASRTCSR